MQVGSNSKKLKTNEALQQKALAERTNLTEVEPTKVCNTKVLQTPVGMSNPEKLSQRSPTHLGIS